MQFRCLHVLSTAPCPLLPLHCNIAAATRPPAPTTPVQTLPPTPTCSNGKIYRTCGTACPFTCDNYLNPPLFCTQQCVAGCFCPLGLVEHGENCVAPSDCPGGINYSYAVTIHYTSRQCQYSSIQGCISSYRKEGLKNMYFSPPHHAWVHEGNGEARARGLHFPQS